MSPSKVWGPKKRSQKIVDQRNENSGQHFVSLLIITLKITWVEMLIKEYFTSYKSLRDQGATWAGFLSRFTMRRFVNLCAIRAWRKAFPIPASSVT